MAKKTRPKKLRLPGVRLPKEVKRRPKKLLKVPGRLQKEETAKPKKAYIQIPVKPVSEKTEAKPPETISKPVELNIKPLQPEEIEKILQGMTPTEPKKAEEKIRQGQYKQALPYLKKWLIQRVHEWDWKTLTTLTAVLVVVLLSSLVIYKVYDHTSGWKEDAQNIKIPEDQLFQPKTSEAEKVIDQLRTKIGHTYEQETGQEEPDTTPTPPPSLTPKPPLPANYPRTGRPFTSGGEINENVIRKFLADAGDLYYQLPKDSQIQLGFYDETGEPVQKFFYYIEGGYLTSGRTRSAEFLLYLPQSYTYSLATTPDPCGLLQEIYNRKNYKFTALRSELALRQKYGGLLRNIKDCRNRE